MSNGKIIPCIGDPDSSHDVDRSLCILGSRPGCVGCPRRYFTLQFQLRPVDYVVACPRWSSEKERQERREPITYEMLSRSICLTQRPFAQCEGCPNSRPSEAPRTAPRWWEIEERARLLELKLDEEERG